MVGRGGVCQLPHPERVNAANAGLQFGLADAGDMPYSKCDDMLHTLRMAIAQAADVIRTQQTEKRKPPKRAKKVAFARETSKDKDDDYVASDEHASSESAGGSSDSAEDPCFNAKKRRAPSRAKKAVNDSAPTERPKRVRKSKTAASTPTTIDMSTFFGAAAPSEETEALAEDTQDERSAEATPKAQRSGVVNREKSRTRLIESMQRSVNKVDERLAGRTKAIEELSRMRTIMKLRNAAEYVGGLDEEGNRLKLLNELRAKLAERYISPIVDAAPFQAALVKNLDLRNFKAEQLPTLSRAYEEAQMYEANEREGRRPCFNQVDCECYRMCVHHLGTEPFIMQEFLLPDELELFKQTGELPQYPEECVLCRRVALFLDYIGLLFDATEPVVQIASYWNRVGEEGEYDPGCCLLPPSNQFMGIEHPVVVHDRDMLTVVFDEAKQARRMVHTDAANFHLASAA